MARVWYVAIRTCADTASSTTPNDDVAGHNLHITVGGQRFMKSLKNNFLEYKIPKIKTQIYRLPDGIFQKFKKYFVI